MTELFEVVSSELLTLDLAGVKYVGWNANRFDAYFIAACLLTSDEYVIRPYLTRSRALRGLRVEWKCPPKTWKHKKLPSWEFVDGIAMTGLVGMSLQKFLTTFAPDYGKLVDEINFDVEEFDAGNPRHREYAYRDSVGLWHGITRAQNIFLEHLHQGFGVTMGGACIKVFQAHIPESTDIIPLRPDVDTIIREYVMRGGYCHCVKQYQGPVWKYDLNQAYAAAMREIKMPSGYASHTLGGVHPKADVYIARVRGENPNGKIPFYYRTLRSGRMYSASDAKKIDDTWLTSLEVTQLQSEGWNLDISESWRFSDSFDMSDFVNKLERLRTTCEGGPSGPIGTMIKAAGNNAYGKTVEVLDPIEFLISASRPDGGYVPFYPDGADSPLHHVFVRTIPVAEQKSKDYHHPHIGAWITAHVRMQVRRAALVAPDSWLYADTDCVIFDADVTDRLDIDPKRYGAFKIEETGAEYLIIAKKVYVEIDDDIPIEKRKKSAKGLNVRRLTDAEWKDWGRGIVPVQDQVQLAKFDLVMSGREMYRSLRRRGTATLFSHGSSSK